jgi:hypothetical protein
MATQVLKEPPVIKDTNLLAEPFKSIALEILITLKREGFKAFVIETKRSRERQEWLYGYGRTHHKANPVKTKVLHSKHETGIAIDIGFKDSKGNVIWDSKYSGWKRLDELAHLHRLRAGYDWKMHDCPHIELP